jgi:hypothetical protein
MSDPKRQVSARPVTWTIWAIAAVLPLLFALLAWQLYSLNPERYCAIVKVTGEPSGSDCYNLLRDGLRIKGYTIWGLVGGIVVFTLVLLVATVKAVVSVVGPAGLQLNIGAKSEDCDEYQTRPEQELDRHA